MQSSNDFHLPPELTTRLETARFKLARKREDDERREREAKERRERELAEVWAKAVSEIMATFEQEIAPFVAVETSEHDEPGESILARISLPNCAPITREFTRRYRARGNEDGYRAVRSARRSDYPKEGDIPTEYTICGYKLKQFTHEPADADGVHPWKVIELWETYHDTSEPCEYPIITDDLDLALGYAQERYLNAVALNSEAIRLMDERRGQRRPWSSASVLCDLCGEPTDRSNNPHQRCMRDEEARDAARDQ
jgi:hypothetical protein